MGDRSHEVRYVYDLPYTERKALCNILDMNNQWQKLGGTYMGFKVHDLHEMQRAERCMESPTDHLLRIWGQQNHTVLELYRLLSKMEHYQAMRVILPFIPAKFHVLMYKGETSLTTISSYRKPSPGHEIGGSARDNNSVGVAASHHANTAVNTSMNGTVDSHKSHELPRPPVAVLSAALEQAKAAGVVTDRTTATNSTVKKYSNHNLDRSSSRDELNGTSKVPQSLLSPMNGALGPQPASLPAPQPSPAVQDKTSLSQQHSLKKMNDEENLRNSLVSCEDNREAYQPAECAKPKDDHLKDYNDKVAAKAKEAGYAVSNTGDVKWKQETGKSSAKGSTPASPKEKTDRSHPPSTPEGPSLDLQPTGRKSRCSNASDISSTKSDCSVPLIPYKELEESTKGWSQDHILGRGGFGTVFRGFWKNTYVAIKRIEPHGDIVLGGIPIHISQSLDERRLLQSYRHDNILQLFGFSSDQDKPHCLVYQFMPNGSLEDRLLCRRIKAFGDGLPQNAGAPLSWWQRYNVAWGTARALQFLHTVKGKPLIHGDVKSANILLDRNYEPKLGDFGLAREGPDSEYTSMKVSRVNGTKPYLPEEYLRNKKLSKKVDTFSYGIVLFEICTGLRAYDENRPKKFLKDLVEDVSAAQMDSLRDQKGGNENKEVFTALFQLGTACIRHEVKRRPDMTRVYQELGNFEELLEERARAKKLTMEENASLESSHLSPLVLQVYHDTHQSLPSPTHSPYTQQSFLNPQHHNLHSPHMPPTSFASPQASAMVHHPLMHQSPHSPIPQPSHSPYPSPHSPYPSPHSPVPFTFTPPSPSFVRARPSGRYFPASPQLQRQQGTTGKQYGSMPYAHPAVANNPMLRGMTPEAAAVVGGGADMLGHPYINGVPPGMSRPLAAKPFIPAPQINVSPPSGASSEGREPPSYSEAMNPRVNPTEYVAAMLPQMLDHSIHFPESTQPNSIQSAGTNAYASGAAHMEGGSHVPSHSYLPTQVATAQWVAANNLPTVLPEIPTMPGPPLLTALGTKSESHSIHGESKNSAVESLESTVSG